MTVEQPHRTPIVVISAGGLPTTLVVNALAARFSKVHVLLEDPESKSEVLRRRARRFGWLNAIGQLGTMICSRLLKRISQTRSNEIVASTGLSAQMSDQVEVQHVGDLNHHTLLSVLDVIKPAAVLLVSTRLMKRETLSQIHCPLMNLHAGINPTYRGQMGGYWSLVKNDIENFGATVHMVDAGTDTGSTVYEAHARPVAGDNISTYPLLLTATALPAVVQAMEDAVSGHLKTVARPGPSALYFPPTVWGWMWRGITRKIW